MCTIVTVSRYISPREAVPKKKGGKRAREALVYTPVEWHPPAGECPFCPAGDCPGGRRLYRPLPELQAVPRREYGIEVVALVLEQYYRGVSLPRIHRLLTEEYEVRISQTHVGNLLRLGLAFVHCRHIGNDHVRNRLRQQGGILLSADAVNTDETSAALYVVRDVLSSEILIARRMELRGAEHLVPLFEEVRKLEVPVLGVISDKEAAILGAAAEVFPEAPHQLCQTHYLQNLAKPMDTRVQEVARGVRTVTREIRAIEKKLLKKEEREPESGPSERTTVLQLCRVAGSAAKSRGDNLLDPTPLKRYERLKKVEKAALEASQRPGGPWPLITELLERL